MAKYTRYRKYSRRNRTHWSSRMINISKSYNYSGDQTLYASGVLAANPAQSTDTISQKFTVKNVWCQFSVESDTDDVNVVDNLQLFVLFIPQGYSMSNETPYDHPEWIMAQKYIGTANLSNNPGYGPLSVRSRLARTLDTGDSIKWLCIGVGKSGVNTSKVTIKGICRFNTKAN